jgi:hypothetical protein
MLDAFSSYFLHRWLLPSLITIPAAKMPEVVGTTTTGFLLKISAAHLFPICLSSKSSAPSPLVTTSGKQCSLAVCSSCYPITHRVGRVLSFSSSRRNWESPNPPPSVLPPLVPGGGAHSLAREGMGESPFQRRNIHRGTLHIYVLCAITLPQADPPIAPWLANNKLILNNPYVRKC